jgi:hypothetical protein
MLAYMNCSSDPWCLHNSLQVLYWQVCLWICQRSDLKSMQHTCLHTKAVPVFYQYEQYDKQEYCWLWANITESDSYEQKTCIFIVFSRDRYQWSAVRKMNTCILPSVPFIVSSFSLIVTITTTHIYFRFTFLH